MSETECWYRYDDYMVAPLLDEYEYPIGMPKCKVALNKLPVIKHTQKGVWLDLGFGEKRFVLKDARKRFACPSIEEAKESFIRRKTRQIKIYKNRLKDAQDALNIINEVNNGHIL